MVLPSAPEGTCETQYVDQEKVTRVLSQMKAEGTFQDLAETFKILGDSTRIKILFALSKAELSVCDLAHLLRVSTSAVSHQLRLLRNMKLVKFRKEGKMAYYSLDDAHIETLFTEGLRHVEE